MHGSIARNLRRYRWCNLGTQHNRMEKDRGQQVGNEGELGCGGCGDECGVTIVIFQVVHLPCCISQCIDDLIPQ